MNILVTGGCGFIGQNFVYELMDSYPQHQVFIVDKMTYAGDRKALDYFSSSVYNIPVKEMDINNVTDKTLEEWKIDYIVNFAAETHVDNSIASPGIFTITNTMGTHNLLEWARKYGKLKKFIQVSTDEVYGSLGNYGLFIETTPLAPSSPYSASKAAADQMCLAYYKTFGLPVVVTRCSNNYGPYQHPEKLIPKAITNLISGKKVPIYGLGVNVRDWIHVKDHCAAILSVMNSGKNGEVYNIGASNELKNVDIIREIAVSTLGMDWDESVEFVNDRPGHDLRYAIDSTKIRALGWKPYRSGFTDTVNWYINNRHWWKDKVS